MLEGNRLGEHQAGDASTANEVANQILVIGAGLFRNPPKTNLKPAPEKPDLKKPKILEGRCQVAYWQPKERFVIAVDYEPPLNGEVLSLSSCGKNVLTLNALANNGSFGFGRGDLIFSVSSVKKEEITNICDALNRKKSLVF
ncbi:MAG: hypothetical protein Q8N68_02945 [bacterium]|nr:hypothetical protein [bacterium]